MEVKSLPPVFFARTRSFWLGILPLALTLLDSLFAVGSSGAGGPVADLIAAVFGWEPETVRGWLLLISPVWGMIIAQQRSGITQPYAMTPAGEQQPQAILVKEVEPVKAEAVKKEVAAAVSVATDQPVSVTN